MNDTHTLGAKGKRLLAILVAEVRSGRIQKFQPRTFVPYSEAMALLELPDPEIYPGRRLQGEGLTELNEWTKAQPEIPKIAGLIINKGTFIPSEGYPESHGFKKGEDWEDWWLNETAKSVDYDWSAHLQ
jgi:hypothetical protein